MLKASLALLLHLLAGVALAVDPSLPAPSDIQELNNPYYQGYDARAGSRFVQSLLAMPYGEDLSAAETARVALFLVGRDEEGALLQQFMASDVVAEVLQRTRPSPCTVGEAIELQRVNPAFDYRLSVPNAYAVAFRRAEKPASTWGTGVRIPHRNVLLLQRHLHFGLPGAGPDTPRERARRIVRASSCLDRDDCSLRTLLRAMKSRYVPERAMQVGVGLTYAAMLAGLFVLALRRRKASQLALVLSRIALLPACGHLGYVAFWLWSQSPRRLGDGVPTAAAILPGAMFALAALALVFAAVLLLLALFGHPKAAAEP